MKNSDIAAVLAILLIILSCFFLIWLTDHSDETDDGNVNISGGETPETGSDLSEDNEDEEKTPTPSVIGHALPLSDRELRIRIADYYGRDVYVSIFGEEPPETGADSELSEENEDGKKTPTPSVIGESLPLYDRELRIWMAGYFGHDEYVKMFREEPPETGPDTSSGDNDPPLSDREARIRIADFYGHDVYVSIFGEEPPETGADSELSEENEDGKKTPIPSVIREPISLYSQEERIRIVELYGRDIYMIMFGEEPPETDTDPDSSEDNENEERRRCCLISKSPFLNHVF